MAVRLRRYSEHARNALTLPDFLEQRFHDTRHILRVVAAAFILLFFLFYTSSGLVAGGKLFNAVFGLPYHWAVFAGTAAILLYTFFGGFLAVSWTDLFQGLLMVLALIVAPAAAVIVLGGPGHVLDSLSRRNPALLDAWTDVSGEPLSMIAMLSLLGWGLGYFGQPHILARFKAIHAAEAMAAARRIAMGWSAISMAGAVLVGLAGIVYLEQPLAGADTEKVFIVMVNLLFHPVIAGVCLAAILAAIMSTADSQLLVSASVLTEDFYKTLFRPGAPDAELVWVGRAAVVTIALIAFALAWDPGAKVLDLVAYAWAGFGAAFGPVLLLALYWRRMTWEGALAGMVCGGTTVVVWKQLHGGLFELYELVPGFVLAGLAVVVASRLSPPPAAAIQDEFDAVLR
jgi:sodium/proline symporter